VLLVFALWMTAVFMLNKLQILSIIFNVRLTCNKQIKSFCSDLKRNSNFLSEKNVERKLIIERVRQMAPKPLSSNFTFFVFFKIFSNEIESFCQKDFFLKTSKFDQKWNIILSGQHFELCQYTCSNQNEYIALFL
jgi:hypothetical protein